MLSVRVAIVALATVACMFFAFRTVEFDSVVVSISDSKPAYLAFAAALILCNVLLALVRFKVVLGVFGYSPPWRQLFSAFSIGQLANQIILNVIGQSLSRASILVSTGVPFGATVIATIFERLLAAGILFSLSLIAAWTLIPQFGFDLELGGAYFLSLVGGIALVGLAAIVFVWRPTRLLHRIGAGVRAGLRFWSSALLTIAAQICMLGAYVVALIGLGLEEPTVDVVAALLIVMFVSSLPISLAGWGVRELSAIAALGVVGIEPSVSFAAAVVVGGLSLISMIGFSAWGSVLYLIPGRAHVVENAPRDPETLDRWSAKLVTLSGALVALGIFFQARLQLESGQVSANVADIVALIGLGFTFFLLVRSRSRFAALPRSLLLTLTVISLLIVFGLLHGYARFGWNDWAMINRGIGWLIILGYVAVGISVALFLAERGRRLILSLFVTAGTTIAVSQLALMAAFWLDARLPIDAFTVPLQGYANNPNAFAFQMVIVAAAAIIASRLGMFGNRRRWLAFVLILTGLAVYFANSRAGVGMYGIAIVLWVLLALPSERRSTVTTLFAVVVCLIAGIMLLGNIPWIVDWLSGTSGRGGGGFQIGTRFYRPSSDSERWTTILDGWRLWLESPIYGNGLGAHVQERLSASENFVIIHSVPVWLMAEMGLIGLVAVVFGFARLFLSATRLLPDPAYRAWGVGLIIMLMCAGAANLVHDFFFQRSFWFVLALGFALPLASPMRWPWQRAVAKKTG